ncbi:MAG: FHA domain-containing protein [Planctomycetota bacterium]|jgi:pSer/pThr/pTyr-binding forkhead associated (FHA) protein
MATIIVVTGDQKGDYYPLGYRTNVVGRSETASIQIVEDHISREHLRIRYEPDQHGYYALDMNSKHGVFINDRKIEVETALAEGDKILVGTTTLLFTMNDFTNTESALMYSKQIGECMRRTQID